MRFMVILQSWDLLVERIRTLLGGASQAILDLLLALVVVMAGWLLALVVAQLALLLLRTLRFNEGVRGLLGEGTPPPRHEPSRVAAQVVQGTMIVLAVMLAADVLGFELEDLQMATTNAIEASFLPDDVKTEVRKRHFGWVDGV